MSFLSFSLSSKRKQPKHKAAPDKPMYLSQPCVSQRLVSGTFTDMIRLPPCVDGNEWLAFNTFEFFTYIYMFYDSVTDMCTCPTMTGPGGIEYTWFDKKRKLCAREHVANASVLIESFLNNEDIFPTKSGRDFPSEFQSKVKQIFQLLFQIFAHMYHRHYDTIFALGEQPHINSLFAHFISFSREFGLLEKKDTLPLQELIDTMAAIGVFV